MIAKRPVGSLQSKAWFIYKGKLYRVIEVMSVSAKVEHLSSKTECYFGIKVEVDVEIPDENPIERSVR